MIQHRDTSAVAVVAACDMLGSWTSRLSTRFMFSQLHVFSSLLCWLKSTDCCILFYWHVRNFNNRTGQVHSFGRSFEHFACVACKSIMLGLYFEPASTLSLFEQQTFAVHFSKAPNCILCTVISDGEKQIRRCFASCDCVNTRATCTYCPFAGSKPLPLMNWKNSHCEFVE